MKIAVLMSTYNGHKYLNEQIKSLASQSVAKDIILYIRDDGSSDDTLDIIESWKSKINIVCIKGKNIGPAMSFWKLLMNPKIQADYYALCDQDDIWDCNKLERAVKALKQEEGVCLWCSNCRIIDSKGKVIQRELYNQKPDFSIDSQIVCGTTQGCAMTFDNKLRKYIMDKKIDGYPMHDFVLMTYAIALGKIIYEEQPSFGYRVHDNNVVARAGKRKTKKIIDAYNRWFSNKHKNELSRYLKIFCANNRNYLDKKTLDFLEDIYKSPHNFTKRLKVVHNSKCKSYNKKSERTFKIRTLLGVI